jgi:hypothetical protein
LSTTTWWGSWCWRYRYENNQRKSNWLAEMKSPSRKGEGLGIGAGINANRQLRWMQPALLKTLSLSETAWRA